MFLQVAKCLDERPLEALHTADRVWGLVISPHRDLLTTFHCSVGRATTAHRQLHIVNLIVHGPITRPRVAIRVCGA